MAWERRHIFIVAAALSAASGLFLVLYTGLGMSPTSSSKAALVGKDMDAIELNLLHGEELLGLKAGDKKVSLASLKGSPILLNFWASWCESCASESSLLESITQRYGPRGLKVIGIGVHDQAAKIQEAALKAGKTFTIGVDEDGRVALRYGVTGVPESILIGRDGKIVDKIVGPITGTSVERTIEALLAQGS
jgi:cytochrome c biogenesis protein CcmG/thiol:disulfide interchange protein DsbE